MLKESYSFNCLPNDFIIQKHRLPTDPNKLQLRNNYIFSIEDKHVAHAFINEILPTYTIPAAFSSAYMSVNPTDKPKLL